MSTRSVDGLRAHPKQRTTITRRKITKALREIRKKRLAINHHAVANYAGVARTSVYNRTDLLDQIRAQSTKPSITSAVPAAASESTIVTALREQLHAQKQRYQTEIAELKAEVKTLEQALAAAHRELAWHCS
ncbi:MAG TPA: transposase [Mycobacterium sp.]|nr:transposase [Mycobacterium sp.]